MTRTFKVYDTSGNYIDSLTQVIDCKFELTRVGGCKSAQLVLGTGFRGYQCLDYDYEVRIQDGDTILFSGLVDDHDSDASTGVVTVNLRSYTSLLEGYTTGEDKTFTDSSINTIVSYAFTNWVSPEGDITSSDIDSGFGVTVGSYEVKSDTKVSQVIEDMAALGGNAAWGVDENKQFYFKNGVSTSSPLSVQEGTDCTSLRHVRSGSDMINVLEIHGGPDLDSGNNLSLHVVVDTSDSSYSGESFYQTATKYRKKRRQVSVPGIGKSDDAKLYALGFFRRFGNIREQISVGVTDFDSTSHFKPWAKCIQVKEKSGAILGNNPNVVERVSYVYNENLTGSVFIGYDPRELTAFKQRVENVVEGLFTEEPFVPDPDTAEDLTAVVDGTNADTLHSHTLDSGISDITSVTAQDIEDVVGQLDGVENYPSVTPENLRDVTDGGDATNLHTHMILSDENPQPLGVAGAVTPGTGAKAARDNHVHGVISEDTPQPLGTAAPGTTGKVSDAGHVHAMPVYI